MWHCIARRAAMGSLLAVTVGVAQAETAEVQVERLMITHPAAGDDHRHMMLDLWVKMPGIARLGDSARVVSLEDDQGNDLLETEREAKALFGFDPAERGYLMRHQVEANLEEGWLRIPAFAPNVPHRDATSLSMELELELLLAGDGEHSVQVEGVDFTHVPGWGVDIDVDGHTLTCRDERRERPEDEPLELFCFVRGGSLQGVTALGQADTPEPSHPESNLVVVGDRGDVSLEVTMPESYPFHQVVQREFGLGLGR